MSAEFFWLSLAVAAVPGAGVVFALSCALAQGVRGAFWGAVAGAVAVVPPLVLVGLGVTALATQPIFYNGLRVCGGVYLLWLAVQTWRKRRAGLQLDPSATSSAAMVLKGAMLNLLNPKLTLFFLAFLPQFLPANDPTPLRSLALMGLVLVAQSFVVFLGYGLCAARASRALHRNPRWMARLQTGIAAVFCGLGLRVLWAQG